MSAKISKYRFFSKLYKEKFTTSFIFSTTLQTCQFINIQLINELTTQSGKLINNSESLQSKILQIHKTLVVLQSFSSDY